MIVYCLLVCLLTDTVKFKKGEFADEALLELCSNNACSSDNSGFASKGSARWSSRR